MLEQNNNKEFKVGIVFFLGFIILFGGIMIGKGFKFSSEDDLLKIRFPNSGGLQPGEPVVVNGVKRGTVVSVKNDNSSVLVLVQLDSYKDIKSDASAKITILEVTGGKKLEINPGISSNIFALNNELPGTTPPDLAELVAVLGSVSGELISLVKNLDTIVGGATDLFADGTLVTDLKQTVSNTVVLTNSINDLVAKNKGNIQSSLNDLAIITKDIKEFIKLNKTNLNNIVNNADTALVSVKTLMTKLEATVNKADNLIANADGLIVDIKTKDGLVKKLIYDEKFANSLDSTFNSLIDLVNMIKEHGVNVNVRLGSRP
ncbi:MAG TPA: MlaD family protein [Candidatus Kapabacteria bacterium]|nr:MlaD family protein [Candidatus Kapabacteria bacterium]